MMIFINILIIILFLVLVLIFFLPVVQAKKSKLITEGVIIGFRCVSRKNTYGGYTPCYLPIFKFSVEGKEYIKESFSGVNEKIYKEGQQIEVAYYKENPMDAIILSERKSRIIMGIGYTTFVAIEGFSVLLLTLNKDILLFEEQFSLSRILLVLGFIVLIIFYFINIIMKRVKTYGA